MLPNQRFWRSSPRVDRKYSPDQPRVPAGYREGGRWTGEDSHWTPVSSGGGISIALPTINVGPESDELSDFANDLLGGLGQALGELRDALARIRLAGDIPTGDSPPEIPKIRQPTMRERNVIARAVAGRLGPYIWLAVETGHWLYEHRAEINSSFDAPKTLVELQAGALDPRPGYDVHHIVERAAGSRENFSQQLIGSPDNLVAIPRWKHWLINAWYQVPNEEFGWQTPRSYLVGKSWDVHWAVGLKALRLVGVLNP
jgi:hypothetical protein